MDALRRALRILGWTLAVLVLSFVVLGVWYRAASSPDLEGSVAVDGLKAKVQIRRDSEGIPTIVASGESDAAFGLGFAHAQDRLWQMEFNRRLAAGRLAEVLGRSALSTDLFLRTLGVHRTAQRIYEGLPAPERAVLDAYAAGVNASFAARRGPLPPEFLLARAPSPSPWTAADSIAWSLMMAWDLASHSMRMELRRLRLSTHFTTAELDDFFPPLSDERAPQGADFVEVYRLLGLRKTAARSSQVSMAQVPDAGFGVGEGLGSNNWVVAGSRTVSGRPLLANDPHLGLTAPSVWYFAALSAPGLSAIGATLPGVPGVVIGRNDRVAWGFTNTGVDQQDLYLERLNPDNPAQYQAPGGWTAFTKRTERFAVKGEADVERVVLETRHGPVLSGLESIDKSFRHPGFVLALRWSALETDDRTVGAILGMNRATSAAEFRSALARFDVVTQSAVFADVDGDIGFFVTGRVPVRARENDSLGRVPALGWEARFDWQGFLPASEVPQSGNPASGTLVTANNRITAPGYPHHLTHDWFTPYRARRIEGLLADRPKHDVASMRSIQADVISLAARELMPLLAGSAPQTTAGQDALARLLAWGGSMSAERPEPLLFHAWMRELKQRVFADDLGELAPEFVDNADLTRALIHVLTGRARSRDWCDDRSTPSRIESCQTLASEALDAAVVRATSAEGVDVAGLRWGDAHRAIAEHRPFSSVPLLGTLFELSTPYPGDTFTVNVGALSHRADAPFTTRHAASLRMIVDLSAPAEKSLWIQSTGQSGNALSGNYASMLPRWRDVLFVPMRATTDAAPSVLELSPR